MAKKRTRTSRAEWFASALDLLEREGIDGVRIDVIAKSLGTSRSGFYWHFKDRGALLQQLLHYWAHEFTEVISTNPEMIAAEPRFTLEETARRVDQHDLARYDLAFLAWAKQDKAVAKEVKRVFDMRLDFVRENFRALGFGGIDLEMRTRLFVCYQSWEQAMYFSDSKRRLSRLRQPRLDFLMAGAQS